MDMTMSQLASKFLAAAKKTDAVTDQKMATLAQVGVGLVKSEIQAMHAVDTGTMLNSSVAEKVAKTTYLIGPTVDYAVYVALLLGTLVNDSGVVVAAIGLSMLVPLLIATYARWILGITRGLRPSVPEPAAPEPAVPTKTH